MSDVTVVRPRSTPSEAPPLLAVLLRVFAVPVFGFLAFGVIVAFGLPSDKIGLLGLAIATGTLILTVVAVDRARPRERRNLLFSLFSFSYFVFFVFPVFAFYLSDAGYTPENSPNPILLTPEVVTRGMLAAFVAYAMLVVGFALPFGRVAANIVPRMRREWSAETALAVALVTIPLGWSVVLAGQFGMIPERAGSGVIGTLAMGSSFGIGLIALCYQRYRSRAALLLMALVIPPTMFFNFFTASKGRFLMPIMLVAISHVLVTRRLRGWWVVAAVIGMALFYPVATVYRLYAFERDLRAVEVIANPQRALGLMSKYLAASDPGEYFESGLTATARRLDGLGILSVIVRDAGTRVPFQGGWTLSYIPMSYIPRVLWPSKPRFTIGKWVTDNFGSGAHIESSTGCTWPGEFYFNFGWLGLVVGMGLLGVWLRFLQQSFLNIEATIPALLAGTVAILSLGTGVGGDMLGATNRVIFEIAPIILMHLVVITITSPPARLPPPL